MIINSLGASEAGHQGTAIYFKEGEKPRFLLTDGALIVDDKYEPVEPGEVGWIARKGRIPLGYYGDPVKTASTFKLINGERYVIPGDKAQLHDDGLITLLGRGAICINSGGEKVYPEEVEEALKAHPQVMDVLVVGVPDERWGERVEAVVQPRAGVDPDLDSIDSFCRSKVAGYKAPRAYHFVAEVSRQPSGKPDYKWAKETAVAAGR
jgi:acyl-CoA synthetase (AMP-forming)/AMP-acid ligase II